MGIPTLISTSTASGASSIDITSGIDSTYDEYMFVFTDVNPATDGAYFSFQVNADGQTGFNETVTSTYFKAEHGEDDTVQGPAYDTGNDQAQGTAYQYLAAGIGNGSDECMAGGFHLFAPSSTSKVKHFYSTVQYSHLSNYSINAFAAGYVNNAASAITEISFKMSSGNFDGSIHFFGVG